MTRKDVNHGLLPGPESGILSLKETSQDYVVMASGPVPLPSLAGARHVILDFDGVVADSEDLQLRTWADLLRERNLPREGLSIAAIAGISDRLAIERVCPGLEPAVYDSLVEEKKRRCATRSAEIEPVPGILELLSRLRDKGLFICSSSHRLAIQEFLARALPTVTFDAIVSREDYARRKPDPEPYLTVLRRARISPSEAVVIEDSAAGVQSAQAAGIPVIHLDRYGQKLNGVPSISSLRGLAA